MCLKREDVERMDDAQRRVNQSNFDQNWLVYGPAGTGKTILALNRLKRLIDMRPGEDHVYIARSKLLGRWVEGAAVELGVATYVRTFDQYVWNAVGRMIMRNPVKLYPNERWSPINWEQTTPLIEEAFRERPETRRLSLIVDEAQDIDVGFFVAARTFCSRMFVLMDENQKTGVWADTRRNEITAALGIDSDHQHYLGVNYRNPQEIKALSESFFDGNRSELADAPEDERMRRTIEAHPSIRCLPFDGTQDGRNQVNRIVSYCAERPNATVLVVAPSREHVDRVYLALAERARRERGLSQLAGWRIRKYVPRAFAPVRLDVCSSGIIVSTAFNSKGTEFDAVFLVEWQHSRDERPLLYTAIARARARVEILAGDDESSRSAIMSQFSSALEADLVTVAS